MLHFVCFRQASQWSRWYERILFHCLSQHKGGVGIVARSVKIFYYIHYPLSSVHCRLWPIELLAWGSRSNPTGGATKGRYTGTQTIEYAYCRGGLVPGASRKSSFHSAPPHDANDDHQYPLFPMILVRMLTCPRLHSAKLYLSPLHSSALLVHSLIESLSS